MISSSSVLTGTFLLDTDFSREVCAVGTSSLYHQQELTLHSQISRGPEEIKKTNGFETLGKKNNLPENISLWDHCKVKAAKEKFGNRKDDGYVSTSSDIGVCVKWVMEYLEDPKGSTIYKVASDKNLIGCHDTLKSCTYTSLLCSNALQANTDSYGFRQSAARRARVCCDWRYPLGASHGLVHRI